MDKDRVTGSAKSAAGAVERAVGAGIGDDRMRAEGDARDAEGTVENLVGQAKDAVRQAADQASDIAGDVYEQSRRYIEEGRRRLPEAERYYREGSQAVSQQVGESPFVALLLAGAVGYAIAYLVHGRR